MALKRNNNQNNAPAFEDVPGTADEAVATETAAPWEDGAQGEVKAEASTAIAASAATSAAAVAAEKAQQFKAELESMKDSISFDWGTLPTYKASNGEIAETGNGKSSFGKFLDGRLMSFGGFVQVSPGDSGAKTKGFVAFSKDGKVIDSVIGDGAERTFVGKPVQAYLDYLRETEGLEQASAKDYLNLAMLVIDSESKTVEPGTFVNVVLSQSSIRSFRAYEEQLKLNARAMAMGLPVKGGLSADPFKFRLVAEQAVNAKGQRWAKIGIEPIA